MLIVILLMALSALVVPTLIDLIGRTQHTYQNREIERWNGADQGSPR